MKTLLKPFGTQSLRLCIIALIAVTGLIISCGGGGGGGGGITTPPGEKPGDPPVTVPECDHNWSNWLVIYIPAETAPGAAVPMTEKRTCSICGQAETRNTTTFVPTVIIDLTSYSVTGTANTASAPDITISPMASDVVLIIGDGTNGGAGRDVKINNAAQIYIADGVTIRGNSVALTVPDSPLITGGGAVTINNGGSGPGIFTSGGDLTISGTINVISSNASLPIVSNNLTITGMIGAVITNSTGGSPCINSGGDIDISGTIGGTNGTIMANKNITISGTVGAITGIGGAGISSSTGNITISGSVGAVKGGDNASGDGRPGILANTGIVKITGTVGSNTADDIKGGSGAPGYSDGPQIMIGAASYNNWPAVKSWP